MGDGTDPSASRLIAVPSLLAVNILPTLVWAYLSFNSGCLVEVPGTVIGYIGAINGALLGYLAAHKKMEG